MNNIICGIVFFHFANKLSYYYLFSYHFLCKLGKINLPQKEEDVIVNVFKLNVNRKLGNIHFESIAIEIILSNVSYQGLISISNYFLLVLNKIMVNCSFCWLNFIKNYGRDMIADWKHS